MNRINYLKLAKDAYNIADSKKAVDPLLLNVRKLTTLADYFLIVTAQSAPQMYAIIDALYKTFRDDYGILPAHRDGLGSMNWSVIDYGGLVVHVLKPEARKFYALEKMWHGARELNLSKTRSKTASKRK